MCVREIVSSFLMEFIFLPHASAPYPFIGWRIYEHGWDTRTKVTVVFHITCEPVQVRKRLTLRAYFCAYFALIAKKWSRLINDPIKFKILCRPSFQVLHAFIPVSVSLSVLTFPSRRVKRRLRMYCNTRFYRYSHSSLRPQEFRYKSKKKRITLSLRHI